MGGKASSYGSSHRRDPARAQIEAAAMKVLHDDLLAIHAMTECVAEVSPDPLPGEHLTVRNVRNLCVLLNDYANSPALGKGFQSVPPTLLAAAHAWLRATLDCEDYRWDPDQRSAAEGVVWELEEALQNYPCKARRANTGANDPQDCNWPLCGCDPHADKVIETLNEGGFYVAPSSGDNKAMIDAAVEFDAEWFRRCDKYYRKLEKCDEYFVGIYEAMVERSQKP